MYYEWILKKKKKSKPLIREQPFNTGGGGGQENLVSDFKTKIHAKKYPQACKKKIFTCSYFLYPNCFSWKETFYNIY